MTRSHFLLHCPGPRLVLRLEWRHEKAGTPAVSAWERRLVEFLELSGVGRMMADGTNGDEACAEKIDGWIAWETEEGAA